jgi:transcription elongation factor GreA-like protein
MKKRKIQSKIYRETMKDFSKLEKKLEMVFKNKDLLVQAFVHFFLATARMMSEILRAFSTALKDVLSEKMEI